MGRWPRRFARLAYRYALDELSRPAGLLLLFPPAMLLSMLMTGLIVIPLAQLLHLPLGTWAFDLIVIVIPSILTGILGTFRLHRLIELIVRTIDEDERMEGML